MPRIDAGREFVTEVQQRSTFVTVVAWVFIVLSGFATVISILQNILVFTVFRDAEINQAMRANAAGSMPAAAAFMAEHFHLFFLAFLLVSTFTLASSIGLLKRRNWARLSFVGIMVLGILWNLGGLVLQFLMFSSMEEPFSAGGPHPGLRASPFSMTLLVGMAVVNVLLAVGLSVLFGWIAKRLLAPAVREEFIHAAEA